MGRLSTHCGRCVALVLQFANGRSRTRSVSGPLRARLYRSMLLAMEFARYLEEVCAAVSRASGDRRAVTPERFLNFGKGSLGIDGDEAIDLLNHLHDRFGTSFKDFPQDRYFGPESMSLPMLIRHFWRRSTGFSQPLEKLTVCDLARYMWDQRTPPDD